MKKPSVKHIDCCMRARALFLSGRQSVIDPKVKRSLERDAELMTQLREILYEIIENPALPMFESIEETADQTF